MTHTSGASSLLVEMNITEHEADVLPGNYVKDKFGWLEDFLIKLLSLLSAAAVIASQ
jgi:hypothetical protein